MKYKMIALDLDGTLTNSKKEVSAHTRDVLIDIQKKGGCRGACDRKAD